MHTEDESLKREEERIARTLSNAGRRGSLTTNRPGSWHVPTSGGAYSPSREGLRALQEQIKEDERKQPNGNANARGRSPSPSLSPSPTPSISPAPSISPSPSPTPPTNAFTTSGELRVQSVFGDDKDAKDKKNRQEEERLERIMQRRGTFEERDRRRSLDGLATATPPPDNAVLLRRSTPSPNPASLGPKFQEQIICAAKALRQKKAEELVRWSFAVAATARSIAEGVLEGIDILNYSRALEAGANSLRTNLDGGGDGSQYFYEIAGYLGQIYIVTIAVAV